MRLSINITNSTQDMDRFENAEVLRSFYKNKGIDGIELMPVGSTEIPEKITASDINGIHLGFYPCWYDFCNGNTERLDKLYGSRETWIEYYGGTDRSALAARIRRELDMAEEVGAEYVVFHVSECTLDECFTYKQM